jgi:GNAT superfamily N-acetyltransferase
VAYLDDLQFRFASRSDAEAIAALHTDSWRRHYRGAYSDAFLDGDVVADRVAVWGDRLREPDPRCQTILAEGGCGLIAFAHTVFDDDPTWGALLENLHVASGHKRRGVASQLLALTAPAVIERGTRLYVWVLEQNVDARDFYEARGARFVDQALASPPGGVASRLYGSPVKLRYAWADPTVLLGLRVSEPRSHTSRASRNSAG